MKPDIAVIGTGRMGSVLVGAFLKHGLRTTIWNRTRARSEPLAAQGAHVAATVQDAVAAAELIILNVSDYAVSEQLLKHDEVTRALRGKVLVQLVTGSPKQARELAGWAQAHAISYLDGAIMATPNFIGDPGCTILYSGDPTLFHTYKPVLSALGGNTVHVGSDPGHASVLDNALLVSMWGALFGVLQGAALCDAEKFPLDAFLGFYKAVMPVTNGAADEMVQRIQSGHFAGDEKTLATVEICSSSVRLLIEMAKERGLRHAMLDSFDQIFQAALKAGHAQDDLAVLHKFMR